MASSPERLRRTTPSGIWAAAGARSLTLRYPSRGRRVARQRDRQIGPLADAERGEGGRRHVALERRQDLPVHSQPLAREGAQELDGADAGREAVIALERRGSDGDLLRPDRERQR